VNEPELTSFAHSVRKETGPGIGAVEQLLPLLHDIWNTMTARKTMKNYSQITFEFQEPSEQDENAGVGVRIKSLKEVPLPPAAQDQSPGNDDAQISAGEKTLPAADESVNPDTASSAEISDEIFDFTVVSTLNEPQQEPVSVSAPVKAAKSNRGRKSLKTIEEGAALINIPPDEELFSKQYYAIGEVAEMFQVNQSLLRFWETEFDIIQPRKNRKGDRHFRPVDIKNLLLIHDLLRRRKLTIEGAKDFLKKNKRSPERFAMIQSLQKIKGFLLEVRASL
jgi:DNA-binding transcriptional MerR regulator